MFIASFVLCWFVGAALNALLNGRLIRFVLFGASAYFFLMRIMVPLSQAGTDIHYLIQDPEAAWEIIRTFKVEDFE